MQYAIDTKTHDTDLTPRLDVNIAGSLIESILPEPVDDVDDMLVVGIELAITPPQLDLLLKR